MKVIRKRIPLYEGTLTVYYTDDFEKVNQKLKGQLNPVFKDCTAFFFQVEEGRPCIAINPSDYTPGIVAHECKHAVNSVFEWSFIRLDANNDEPECYLLQWMVDAVMNNMPES